jgi:hypothetical protein
MAENSTSGRYQEVANISKKRLDTFTTESYGRVETSLGCLNNPVVHDLTVLCKVDEDISLTSGNRRLHLAIVDNTTTLSVSRLADHFLVVVCCVNEK